MARLATRVWVDAYLARLRLDGIPAFVVAHGDDTAGAVLVKVATLDGRARLMHRFYDFARDVRMWEVLADGTDAELDARIAVQRASDPDLWVIEVEDRAGRHRLDGEGLS